MAHVNFIEIGTSDFDTLLQRQPEDNTINYSIEPIKFYLDALPNKKNVNKINCAISDKDGETTIYYVKPENIAKYGLPDWVRGCNSIGNKHPTVEKLLRNNKLEHILESDKIDVVDIKTFIAKYNIKSINYLKIDTEGHDCIIINSLLQGDILPKKIFFESNVLTPKDLYNQTVIKLKLKGYKVVSVDNFNTLVELD